MTEKQRYAIDTIFSKIPDEYQRIFREIAEYTISLGYIPSIKGASEQYVIFSKSFSKPKINRIILKIATDPKQKNPPSIEMRYFANKFPYSPLFTRAIEDRVYVNGWGDPGQKITGTGNWLCGNCNSTHVYYTINPNGEKITS